MVQVFLLLLQIIICAPVYSTPNSPGTDNPWNWGTASGTYLPADHKDNIAIATLLSGLLANVPQLLLSIGYLNINFICTSMASAHEWNRLGTFSKHLRVTNPVGLQRSTYFLQLPYRWCMPLMAFGGVLHWIMSQAFYLVRIDHFDRQGKKASDSVAACGFSSLSLAIFCAVGLLELCIIGFFGFRKFPMKMPPVGSCSLVISAACHPSFDEVNPQLEKLQWGVVKPANGEEHGHCSLSSKPVEAPVYGEFYH